MAKRTLATGRVINGKLHQKGDEIELKAEDEKALDAEGVLVAKAKPVKADKPEGGKE